MNIIIKYSLINNITNPTPLYSVINPLTSSEGLSEKSNGRRFLSASSKINTMTSIGSRIITPGLAILTIKYFNLTLFKKNTIDNKKNLKHNS